jgi:O-antigen/teichoic acid export membrane protein
MIKNDQIKNILWMFVDKSFLLVGNFIVSVMVARYLGPDQLGLISFGLAIGTFVLTISQWGASYSIFNITPINENRARLFIIFTGKIRFIIYIFSMLIVQLLIFFIFEYEVNDFFIISLMVLSQIFLALDIYQYHYNALLKSKINAKSAIYAKIIALIFRVFFIFIDANLYSFVLVFFIEGFLVYYIRKVALENSNREYKRKYIKEISKKYFKSGFPLMISGVCIVIYTKCNEVILGYLSSYDSVGIYSVALNLNYAWSFIPMSIGVSLLSQPLKDKLIEEKKNGFSFVTFSVLTSCIPILLVSYFFSDNIVNYTYGSEYEIAKEILFIMSVGCMFGVLGFLTNRMIASVDNGNVFLLKKVIVSSFVITILNFFLIKKYGIFGAAYGFLIAEFLNLTLCNYLFKNGYIFHIHIRMIKNLSYIKKYM